MAKKKKVIRNEAQERFSAMSRDDRAVIVRVKINDGGSYRSVARDLGVGIGTIAGICRDYGISAKKSIPDMSETSPSSTAIRPKLAPSEKCQCSAAVDGHRCAYERLPGSEYCPLPAHQALERHRR